MRRGRRHLRMPPDLTSLFDVLFIVIFAALIRAAAVQQAAAQTATRPPAPPPVKLDPASLHARALQAAHAELAARPPLIVRLSPAGAIIALEAGGTVTALDAALLEHSADPDVRVAYLGDRMPEMSVCRLAAIRLGLTDLARYLVIIAPAQRLADMPQALFDGLHRDVDRCLAEEHGLAVIVEP